MGDFNNATKHDKLYYAAKDSAQTEKSTSELGRIEAQLTNMENLNQIAELEKEKIIQESNIFKMRMLTLGIGAIGLLGFAFFYNARRKNRIISEQNGQLEALNATKDRIFSIIGHDLRKPAIAFQGIGKKVNYLVKKGDYQRLEALGETIEQDANALNKLTDNLLSWALTQKEVMPYNPKALSLAELAVETKTVFQSVAERKGIAFNVQIPNELEVYADQNAVLTMLRNLVDNALKYKPEGGRVDISAKIQAKGVKILVSDTGIGMSADKQRDIFLLQKNKSEKGTDGEKGTGLGLHLVQELAKLNKGAVTVWSRLGEGTNFELSLPSTTQRAVLGA